MTRLPLMLAAVLGLAAPALAQTATTTATTTATDSTATATTTTAAVAGDATKGEKEFNKCKACHSITAEDGTVIMKGSKVGPDLYGVVGRPAGSVEGFAYSEVMKEAGEKGLIWTPENLIAYLPDPSKFLDEKAGESKGKSKMTFKMAKGAEDVVAYLASVKK